MINRSEVVVHPDPSQTLFMPNPEQSYSHSTISVP